MRALCSLIAAISLFMVATWPATASAWQLNFKEWGGGGFYTTDFTLNNHNLQSTGLLAFAAAPLWERPDMRLEWRLEGQMAKYWNYSTGLEMALVPALRFYLLSGHPMGISLYGEGGVGPSYNTLHVNELGLAFNFLSFAGVGLRLPLTETLHLDLGYRMRHISNAGLDDANGGVSSHQLLLELAVQY
ncbi:MAG: acyloxyacyl hydrolase [Pseudomonadota bacterium]